MTFGDAIEAIKAGQRVRRAGWNGKGMFVSAQYGGIAITGRGDLSVAIDGDERKELINGVRRELFNMTDVGTVTRMPCMMLRAADGSIVPGWLASQTDMFAEDWEIAQ